MEKVEKPSNSMHFVTCLAFTVSDSSHTQAPSWRAASCRLSAIVYYILSFMAYLLAVSCPKCEELIRGSLTYTHLLHTVYRNVSVTAEFLIIGIIYVGSSAEYKLIQILPPGQL
jgi:hypothetical protein